MAKVKITNSQRPDYAGAAGTEWTRQMREVLMTLLMWLVELDDATVILHDRIMEEQNKKGD